MIILDANRDDILKELNNSSMVNSEWDRYNYDGLRPNFKDRFYENLEYVKNGNIDMVDRFNNLLDSNNYLYLAMLQMVMHKIGHILNDNEQTAFIITCREYEYSRDVKEYVLRVKARINLRAATSGT